MRHGKGVQIATNGTEIYEGYWENDKRKYGRQIFDTCFSFEGDWTKWEGGPATINGYGKIIFKCGDVKQGVFKASKLEGKGIYV